MVTSGGQVVESVGVLREAGALVRCALCVVDRAAGGADALASIDVDLRPLFNLADLQRSSTGGEPRS